MLIEKHGGKVHVADTLNNVKGVLALLEDMMCLDPEGMTLDAESQHGLFVILHGVKEAVSAVAESDTCEGTLKEVGRAAA